MSAKLIAGGFVAKYSAHFDSSSLVRIEEQREPQDVEASGASLAGEYTYEGARLVRYRGAKLDRPATLDLQFDPREVVLSGQGPDVTNEDISTIRNRAQLLRSHALAQRAARTHSSH